jgi:flagellar FliJ protein
MNETLSTLLEQAEAQRNIALAAFNQARARRDEARVQAQDLDAYRSDYAARWQREFKQRGAALEVMRSYHQFAQRLDQAIAQQSHAIEVCEQAFARANDMLAAHELRCASVRKLIERRVQEQREGVQRREQRAADDLRLAPVRNPFAGTQL